MFLFFTVDIAKIFVLLFNFKNLKYAKFDQILLRFKNLNTVKPKNLPGSEEGGERPCGEARENRQGARSDPRGTGPECAETSEKGQTDHCNSKAELPQSHICSGLRLLRGQSHVT